MFPPMPAKSPAVGRPAAFLVKKSFSLFSLGEPILGRVTFFSSKEDVFQGFDGTFSGFYRHCIKCISKL